MVVEGVIAVLIGLASWHPRKNTDKLHAEPWQKTVAPMAEKWSILYVALSVDRCKDIINLLKSSSMPIARTLPGCK
jgi:hypothetical protein